MTRWYLSAHGSIISQDWSIAKQIRSTMKTIQIYHHAHFSSFCHQKEKKGKKERQNCHIFRDIPTGPHMIRPGAHTWRQVFRFARPKT